MPSWLSAMRFVGVGAYVGVSILLGVYVGSLLDRRFDTQPLFTLLGLALGLAVAVVGVYRMLVAIIKEWQDNDKRS